MAHIDITRRNSVAIITIANEAKRNCFTDTMTRTLGAELKKAENDPRIKCVVVSGAGDVAFSSGHDLQEMLNEPGHVSDPELNAPFLYPMQMQTPTIAAVNGYAYAAGFILAIACDLRVSAENAAFVAPGCRLGLLPIGGQISQLPHLIPRAIAHELLITGRRLDAEEAFRLGFVNRLVPFGEAVIHSLAIAESITESSSAVVREIKIGLQKLEHDGHAAAAQFEWECGKRIQNSDDAKEGMRAFLEKRAPEFI